MRLQPLDPTIRCSFAFAQLFYEIAVKWVNVTGGSDGLPGGVRPRLGAGG